MADQYTTRYDEYKDDHTRSPEIITAADGKQTPFHYKKIPNPIEGHYAKDGGVTRNLDGLDLNYWLDEIKKRREQVSSYTAEVDLTGRKQYPDDSALSRARTAVRAVVLVDTFDQLIEHFAKPAEKEIQRLEEGFQQGAWEIERVKKWRAVVEGFQVLRDEAQGMADGMKFGEGTLPLPE